MRWLFIVSASAIAFFYYLGINRTVKDMEKGSSGIASTMKAVTGRNEVGTFVPYPSGAFAVEEVEDETPYYFPDTPKDSEQDMRYYA
jgi:hypothetical protein